MLIHGDCLEVLPTLPDASIDMVFADLPYGVTHNKWDVAIPFEPLWGQLLRVGKPRCAFVFTATQPFATTLINSQHKLFRYDLVWDKIGSTGFLNSNRCPLRRHEHVLIFCRAAPVYIPQKTTGRYRNPKIRNSMGANYGKVANPNAITPGGVDRFPVSIIPVPMARGKHPTQKPVALLEWLIKTYSNPGDTVLDPTAGSGTTGVACVNTGRKFIGIEQDAGYFATAEKRIAEANTA